MSAGGDLVARAMTMVDLSVIVVNWNTVQFLLECLRSITPEAIRHPTEILVVDNGSTDGSPEAVATEFPNVTLIQSGSNLGFARANNLALRRSSGRYVCLINPDVVVSEGCLNRMRTYMDEHLSIGILGPKILNCDSTLQLTCWKFPSVWNSLCRALALDAMFPRSALFGDWLMRSWAHDTVKRVDILSGCFWMIRRETLDEVGLLGEEFFLYGEDMDYCKRSWQKGWEIVYLPDATAVHYGGASSSLLPVRFEVERVKAALQYWRKHHGRAAHAAYSAISLLHQVRRILQGAVRYVFNPSEKNKFLMDIHAGVACSLFLFRTFASWRSGSLRELQ